MESKPPSADSTTGFGKVGISEVLPVPALPYTSIFTPLADKPLVDFRLIAIFSSFCITGRTIRLVSVDNLTN
jgi:hypothetical protein